MVTPPPLYAFQNVRSGALLYRPEEHMGESDQAAPGGLGLGFLFGSWMLTALALGGLIGMLRFSAASTPVRTGQRPVVEPFVPTAVEVSPDAERTEHPATMDLQTDRIHGIRRAAVCSADKHALITHNLHGNAAADLKVHFMRPSSDRGTYT